MQGAARFTTIALCLVIASIEYLIPCVPIPEDLTPKNGKWSGPRSVLLLICTVPTSNFRAIVKALPISLVKTEDCSPYSERFAIEIASSIFLTRIIGKIGPKGSSHATSISVVT